MPRAIEPVYGALSVWTADQGSGLSDAQIMLLHCGRDHSCEPNGRSAAIDAHACMPGDAVSGATWAYLEELSKLGTHGTTAPGVAATLVEIGVREAIEKRLFETS